MPLTLQMTTNLSEAVSTQFRSSKNLVTAFGLIFGLDQSRMKFKSILFPFGKQPTNSTQLSGTVILRGPNWSAYPCQVESDSSFRDLGFIYNTTLTGNSQYEATLQRLSVSLNALRYKFPGSWGTEYVMKSVVMARVSYIGQGRLLSDEHLQKLDSVTLRHARQELQLLPGFPSAPLTHHQLIGYPTPSMVYREARLKCFWRGLRRG